MTGDRSGNGICRGFGRFIEIDCTGGGEVDGVAVVQIQLVPTENRLAPVCVTIDLNREYVGAICEVYAARC